MVKSKAIRIFNTVEFFPLHNANPLLNEGEQIGYLLKDLNDLLLNPTRTLPSITYGKELNNALRTMQKLMCKDTSGKQQIQRNQPITISTVPHTRSNTESQEGHVADVDTCQIAEPVLRRCGNKILRHQPILHGTIPRRRRGGV